MNSLTSHLRVSVLSMPIEPGSIDSNLAFVLTACEQLPANTDVLVLPELFTSGFHPKMDLSTAADAPEGRVIETLTNLARAKGLAVAGSFMVKENGLYYNRGFFIEPSGERAFYDKHHLFTAGAEGSLLTAGAKLPPVIRFRGWNISIVTCYDLRFPEWCRNRNSSYDLLLVPANWPAERGYAWKQLLIARAIENQAAVVGANRSGEDKFGHYDDQTFIFDCMGQPIGQTEGDFVTADLDKAVQTQYRSDFPALKEWDSFIL